MSRKSSIIQPVIACVSEIICSSGLKVYPNVRSRLNAALKVVDDMEDTAEDYADFDTDQEKELIKLIQQYDSTAIDIQGNMDISYQRRVEYQQHMLTMHKELKGKLSSDDWRRLFTEDQAK